MSMPLNQLASTALDLIGPHRAEKIVEICRYATNDLLCQRADQPQALADLQEQEWQPLLDWVAQIHGVKLATGFGIMPVSQPAEALQKLGSIVENWDNFRLSGLQQALGVTGSLILGIALAETYITADQAFTVAELESRFQIDKWGDDPVTLNRHASIKKDLADCQSWFELLG